MRDHKIGALLLVLVAVPLVVCVGGCPPAPADFQSDDERRDRILDAYFTDEACEVLCQVPLRYVEIPGFSGLSVGDDWGSRAAAQFWGLADERQVAIHPDHGDHTILHEYIHQADYEGFISRDLFRQRFAWLRSDPVYAGLADALERDVIAAWGDEPGTFISLLYDDGVTRELIPCLVMCYGYGAFDLPDYVLEVYTRALKLDAIRGELPDTGGEGEQCPWGCSEQ